MTTRIDGTFGVDLIKDGTVKAADFDPSLFLASLTSNGYQKLPSGLIIQWGRTSIAPGYKDVTFPIPFPTALLSINITPNIGSTPSSATMFSSAVGTSGLAGFSCASYFYNGASFGMANEALFWIAIGY